jgi:multisubunit Na+/H+ antiporter MnhB subunit
MDLMNYVLYLGCIFGAMTISLFLISKGLKFKKQNLMPAASVVAVINVVIEVGGRLIGLLQRGMSLETFIATSQLFLVITILVGILSIKQLYNEGWIKTIVAFVITFVVMSVVVAILTPDLSGTMIRNIFR